MPPDLKISKKIKREAILWLFDELRESRRTEFEKSVKDLPPLKAYVDDLQKTLNLVDRLPMRYPSDNTTKKNRILVSGRVENYRLASPAARRWDSFFENVREFLSIRFTPVISFCLLAGLLIYFLILKSQPSATAMLPDSPSGPPAVTLSKADRIQRMIDDQTLIVSRVREVKDNSGKITFSIDATPEIFYVGTLEDRLSRNILYFVVRHAGNPGTRLSALKILSKDTFDPTLEELMINILLSEENPGIRLRAIRVLENYPVDENMKNVFIKVLLEDKNNVMRMEALARLSSIDEMDLIPVYQVVSQYEQNEYIKEEAEKLLKRIQKRADSTT